MATRKAESEILDKIEKAFPEIKYVNNEDEHNDAATAIFELSADSKISVYKFLSILSSHKYDIPDEVSWKTNEDKVIVRFWWD